MADTPKHSVSVAGIVIDDHDRVLVIQRRDNAHWEPPGGVLELDESPEAGTRREVLEETGIAVEVSRLSGVYKNMSRGVVSLVFHCRAIAGEARTSSESVAVRWIERSEAADLMDPAYAVRVIDAFQPDVPVRIHNGKRIVDDNEPLSAFTREVQT